jgi:uncharacterized protein YjbK
VWDLKKAILRQERIGRVNDFDLQVANAQTKEGKDEFMDFLVKNFLEVVNEVLLRWIHT